MQENHNKDGNSSPSTSESSNIKFDGKDPRIVKNTGKPRVTPTTSQKTPPPPPLTKKD